MAQVTSFAQDDFIADAENHLGRANGNIYQRVSGVDGVNDGQVLIRLKKKRFVVLDYSIVPNDEDMKAAETQSHIKIPGGAGTVICKRADCNKVGIPICLYDAEPDEPIPLYMRSGLCYQCQRTLNEERRTDSKKRPPKAARSGELGIIYALGPTGKKLKLSGNTIHLKDDAIVINGAIEGTRQFGDNSSFQEMASDLKAVMQEAAQDTAQLVDTFGVNTTENDVDELYSKAFQSMYKSMYLLSQWKASYDSVEKVAAEPSTAPVISQGQTSNVASLLLAAEQDLEHQELLEQVQAQVDLQIQQADEYAQAILEKDQ